MPDKELLLEVLESSRGSAESLRIRSRGGADGRKETLLDFLARARCRGCSWERVRDVTGVMEGLKLCRPEPVGSRVGDEPVGSRVGDGHVRDGEDLKYVDTQDLGDALGCDAAGAGPEKVSSKVKEGVLAI